MAKFTVVTVCLNAENYIERTIKSVLNQEYVNIEYVIKDGNSCDKTNLIIEQYKDDFQQKGIELKHYIEKDNGIYDAMNRAIKVAEGDWIIFMNAGDIFFDSHVLKDVSQGDYADTVDVLYGHTMVELTKNNYKFIAVHDEKLIDEGMSLGHQAMFVKREILLQYQFNCNYKIAADYELCLRLVKSNKHFQRLNLIVARYSREGVSSRNVGLLRKECTDIKNTYKLEYKKSNGIFNKIASAIITVFPIFSDLKYCSNQMKRMAVSFKEDD